MDVISHEYEDLSDRSTNNEHQYAGFWMRFWAFLTDLIIIFSLRGLLLTPLKFINEGIPINIGIWTLNSILASLIFFAYFLLMTKYLGQTMGKMLFGLKVIKENDGPLSWEDLLYREVVGRFIHVVYFALNTLYIVVAFTPKKQGLHDMFADTIVVHSE